MFYYALLRSRFLVATILLGLAIVVWVTGTWDNRIATLVLSAAIATLALLTVLSIVPTNGSRSPP